MVCPGFTQTISRSQIRKIGKNEKLIGVTEQEQNQVDTGE